MTRPPEPVEPRRARLRPGRPPSSPPSPGAGATLARGDLDLLRAIDGALEGGRAAAGTRLACAADCAECCTGPFPINRLDAWRLREGLAALEFRDPARAEAVLARARACAERLARGFPGDPATGRLGRDEDDNEAFFAAHAALPCPALDPQTDRCDLYDHRPLTCRTFGLPVRIGDALLPPCRLCFVGAPAPEIERCRVIIDTDGLEDRLLEAMEGNGGGEEFETVVAAALIAPRGER